MGWSNEVSIKDCTNVVTADIDVVSAAGNSNLPVVYHCQLFHHSMERSQSAQGHQMGNVGRQTGQGPQLLAPWIHSELQPGKFSQSKLWIFSRAKYAKCLSNSDLINLKFLPGTKLKNKHKKKTKANKQTQIHMLMSVVYHCFTVAYSEAWKYPGSRWMHHTAVVSHTGHSSYLQLCGSNL